MAHWITDSQDEQSYEELFRDADQIHVPVFQRRYVWGKSQLDELRRDIQMIRDGIENSQFLGAIVAYERPRVREVVGRLRALDVVDGQQRLLTIYLMVLVIAEQVAPLDADIAAEIVAEFLVLPQRRGLDVNTRIVPTFEDRAQFRRILDRISAPATLGDRLGESTPVPPASAGADDGPLWKQYQRVSRLIRDDLPPANEEKLRALRSLLELVTGRLTFVHLKLTDASVATKIFERLNYRGVRVGIVDLVRNDVFSRADSNPNEALRVYRDLWQPLEHSFGDYAESFFFPYCLVHNSNIKKSELFSGLRSLWSGLNPTQIVAHIEPFRRPFLAIEAPGSTYGRADVDIRLDRLRRLQRPNSVLPFLMSVLHAYENGTISEEQACSLLDVCESFLVRRAVASMEPTGLHAVFKSLWTEIRDEPTAAHAIARIRTRRTVQWPTDAEFRTAIQTRPVAKSKVCSFLLVELDRALPGDHPSDIPTIEHVLPQSYGEPWERSFTREEHRQLVDTWANLVPLSAPLNSSLQAGEYRSKRARYMSESMFVTARHVAERWDDWTPTVVRNRATEISDWAIERWPY